MDPGEGEFWGTFPVRIARWQDAIEIQIIDEQAKPHAAFYLRDEGRLSDIGQLQQRLWHGSLDLSEPLGGE